MRNNNPLNIRRGKTKWLGEVMGLKVRNNNGDVEIVTEEYDRVFCQFQTLEQGWRAAFLLLKKYINVYGCNTIEKIVKRWAPPSENATLTYINDVAFYSCILSNIELEFTDTQKMLAIGSAMCMVENGTHYDPCRNNEWLSAMRGGYDIALRNEQFRKDGAIRS